MFWAGFIRLVCNELMSSERRNHDNNISFKTTSIEYLPEGYRDCDYNNDYSNVELSKPVIILSVP
jgi:hypothetical protein